MYKNSTLSFLSRHSVQLSRPNEGIGFGLFCKDVQQILALMSRYIMSSFTVGKDTVYQSIIKE